jgi:heat shock protein HslJ
LLLAAALLVLGCAPTREVKGSSFTERHEKTAGEELSLERLRGATYRGIYDKPVTLTNGKYEGPPFQPEGAARPRVSLVDKLVARGDLDGDGVDEAVVLLAENSGASGTRNYVAVVAAREGRPVNVATNLIGDRTQLRAMRIEDKRLILDTVAHGPADSMCCPTEKVRRLFMLDGDRLLEIKREETGPISVVDLEGVTWVLEEIGFGDPVAAEPAITLRIDRNQMLGSAGCNNYFAAYTSDGPGQLKVGAAGATRKACAPALMDQEARYFDALGRVTAYGFLAGNLALTYQRDGSLRALIFAPRVP